MLILAYVCFHLTILCAVEKEKKRFPMINTDQYWSELNNCSTYRIDTQVS